MVDGSPYTRKDFVFAVNLSAFLGWTAASLPFAAQGILTGYWRTAAGWVMSMAVIGLPFAFFVAWLIVAPFIRTLMRKPVSYFRAAHWGAAISTGVVLLSIAIGRYHGWRQSLNPTFSSQIGGGDKISSIDGILTHYGWWILMQRSAFFVLVCVGIALIIRVIIGAGKTAKLDRTNQ